MRLMETSIVVSNHDRDGEAMVSDEFFSIGSGGVRDNPKMGKRAHPAKKVEGIRGKAGKMKLLVDALPSPRFSERLKG